MMKHLFKYYSTPVFMNQHSMVLPEYLVQYLLATSTTSSKKKKKN